MLDLISKSKIRQKIILLFINNKGNDYYINKIARLVNTSAGTTQRELKKLLQNGFLVYERKGNLVLFRLNETNPLLKEIESIINKTIGIEGSLRTELQKIKGLEYAFIFGSYAKGDFNAKSDVDLYILGDIDEDRLHKSLNKVEKLLHREVNPHISSLLEFKHKLRNSYFEKEILGKYILIAGEENEFIKITKRT
jgi:predicted nucleotidyltransferase